MQSHPMGRGALRASGGFTLVELLVVMSIIGMLVSLMLPAVQGARESANRAACANNVKQLSLGCLQHLEKQNQYPTGGWGWYWVGDPDRGFGSRQPGGWFYNILPFIDQPDLHDSGKGQSEAVKMEAARQLARTPLIVANCPSRRKPVTYLNNYNATFVAYNANPNVANDNMVARTDYAINCGNQGWNEKFSGPASFTAGDQSLALLATADIHDKRNPGYRDNGGQFNPMVDLTLDGGKPLSPPIRGPNGISYERSQVTSGHVRKGTTCMVLLGKKYVDADKYQTGDWAADNESMYSGFDNDNFRSTCVAPKRDRRGVTSTVHFGSPHPGACNFAFCDGSVRRINYAVDPGIFSNMGDRNNEDTVNVTKL